ncbi:hypothetical protein KUTeg_006557 [Tegillarca granosa]|uniref:CCHC-type domain-containing protein n=1 Tax=Tegillarca granosa TaxID=220873 RepID=A0ABQ9FI80_TEGGR|nr:hypothetical protein KUTeg_006557 [Tegillarca granosa]
MKKLEARFGTKELTETAKVEFQQASQNADESLEDWSDRVMSLALTAFRELPDSYRKQEAISKFCQGCFDKEAGKHACFERPKNIQAALNAIKHFQYISQAVDSKKSRRSKDEYTVNAVSFATEAKVEAMIAKAIDNLANRLQRMDKDKPPKAVTQNDMPPTVATGKCYFCQLPGHMKRDCRQYKKWRAKKDAETAAKSALN